MIHETGASTDTDDLSVTAAMTGRAESADLVNEVTRLLMSRDAEDAVRGGKEADA